jgi:hypothetical protein
VIRVGDAHEELVGIRLQIGESSHNPLDVFVALAWVVVEVAKSLVRDVVKRHTVFETWAVEFIDGRELLDVVLVLVESESRLKALLRLGEDERILGHVVANSHLLDLDRTLVS